MPTTYTPELAAAICDRVANGESLRAVCRDTGVSIGGFLGWVLKHDDLREQYTRAREIQAHVLADETQEIVDSEPDPARARVRLDQRKWHAGKLLPKVYGDKLGLTGGDGGPLQVAVRKFYTPE